MTIKLNAAPVLVFCLVSASTAHAQTPPEASTYFAERVAAPRQAFELTLGTGYTQGFGKLQSSVGMQDVAKPGVAFELGAGYRVDPRWAVGVTGQFFELSAERAAGARGLTAGAAATYHVSPYVRSDPWVQFGAGYRMLWEEHDAPAANLFSHGFQLAKVAAGFDLRFTEDLGVSPVVGADVTTFLWQGGPGPNVIDAPRFSTFVFAGVQGRFDFGALHESRDGAEIARR